VYVGEEERDDVPLKEFEALMDGITPRTAWNGTKCTPSLLRTHSLFLQRHPSTTVHTVAGSVSVSSTVSLSSVNRLMERGRGQNTSTVQCSTVHSTVESDEMDTILLLRKLLVMVLVNDRMMLPPVSL